MLKQGGHLLTDNVASFQKEGIFYIKMPKLLQEGKGSISNKYMVKNDMLHFEAMDQDVTLEALVVHK